MAQKTIELGTAPDGMDGDDARTAFQKTNDNFTELYQGVGGAQPASPKLSAIAASVWAANQLLIATGENTVGALATGVTGRALVAANNAAEGRSAIAAQALHANLTGLSSIPSALNRVPFFTSGAGEMGYFDSTAFTREFMGMADAAAARGKLGLGTAATANVITNNGDTTAGRVLTPGFMGIGARVGFSAPNANFAVYNGFYQGSGGSSTNYPSVNTGYGNLLVMSGSTNYVTQISTFAAGSGINLSEIHFRGSNDNGSTWANWAKLFHSGNAVGTVSQASGLPTGAIIERISNGNGQATKYADGTLVCWGAVTTASIPVNTAAQTLITFPSAFSTAPVVSASVEPVSNWDHYGYTGSSGLSGASGNFFVRYGAATAQQFVIRFLAIGRWF